MVCMKRSLDSTTTSRRLTITCCTPQATMLCLIPSWMPHHCRMQLLPVVPVLMVKLRPACIPHLHLRQLSLKTLESVSVWLLFGGLFVMFGGLFWCVLCVFLLLVGKNVLLLYDAKAKPFISFDFSLASDYRITTHIKLCTKLNETTYQHNKYTSHVV